VVRAAGGIGRAIAVYDEGMRRRVPLGA